MLQVITKPFLQEKKSFYSYLLVVSSDSLYVMSPDRTMLIETIIDGKDTDGYVCAADDEDHFLECIVDIKRDILKGINPLNWIL
jgi:hypothetical protein